MNKAVSLAALLAVAAISSPSLRGEIVYNGASISENFDSLGTAVASNVFLGAIGTHSPVPGTTGFEVTRIAGSDSGGSMSSLILNDGNLNTGGVQNFGADGANDRALGSLASGSRTMVFGFALRNNVAGTVISSITLSFNQENWRRPSAESNTLTAAWGTSASVGVTTSNYLTAAGMTAESSLNLTLASGVNGALDGNLPANQVAKNFVFSSLNLAFGDYLFVRWQDIDNGGNDAGIGMDDMSLTFVATAIPEASAVLLGGAASGSAALAWLVRRRRGA